MKNNESTTSVEKINLFLEKNVKLLLGFIAILLVLVAVIVAVNFVKTKSIEKGLAGLDSVEYVLRKDSESISETDFASRQDKALLDLEEFAGKGGIVGVRANMLKGEILFEKKDYEKSLAAWSKAANLKKQIYTAPICNYNAAVCCEDLGDLDGAISYYKKSVEAEDFYLVDHAYFSLGRVNEIKGLYDDAKAAYKKIEEIHPSSTWAGVAKSRIIAIESSSK
ncbi:tetratricopeptide repeat protein [Treponema pectinovorum]|uniref:tetratricopeptide repeat protein n=1 Tax=Treponema pectinovorum TaxID=164 RepID=UPI0011C88572|nr:tetratricopeptide repeat protein [Treponema pectinovorum]